MWHYLPLSEYIDKLAQTPEPSKGVLRQIWDYYFQRAKVVEEAEIESVSPDLKSAPARLLDWVAPAPNWLEACSAAGAEDNSGANQSADVTDEYASVQAPLELAHFSASDSDDDDTNAFGTAGEAVAHHLSLQLAEWRSSRVTESGVQMILAAPHSGVDAMVHGWSQQQGYLMPATPTSNEILAEGADWLSSLREQITTLIDSGARKPRLVLIGLEKYFLRHHNGLNFLRQLMDYLTTEAPPSLIVCQSWAWAYLTNAIHIEAMVGPPLVLARASDKALGAWIMELSSGSHHRTFTFRQGKQLLFTIEQGTLGELEGEAYQSFCTKLAEISRGNPGIARALWRHSISIEASVDLREQVQSEAADDPGYTVWVQPISQKMLPIVPITFTNNDAFILQTLLVHNGLTRDLLQKALPHSASLIARRIQVMLNAGLVRYQDGMIEVSPLGYISVRAFLRENGFFVDLL